jgi:hypothetical protein
MRTRRPAETSDERRQIQRRQAQLKRIDAEASEAAVDRMIRRNIEEFGP